jgi:uncharacterized protein (TIGR04255 family)
MKREVIKLMQKEVALMGKKYKNPPIVEALCEFRFDPSTPWDLAIPGLVYERLRHEFGKRRTVTTFEESISSGPRGIEREVRAIDRMQFLRDDEKALIQVGQNLLAVNHLKPYPTWQEFLPLIRKGFNAYLEVANPKNIQRIGLRYINRIEIPGRRIELEKYFEFRPFVGAKLPQDFDSFILGIVIAYENRRDNLRLQIEKSAVETSDTIVIMLDLDYFLAIPGQVLPDKVFEWVEIAHNHVEEAFEASITNELRQMFEEAK